MEKELRAVKRLRVEEQDAASRPEDAAPYVSTRWESFADVTPKRKISHSICQQHVSNKIVHGALVPKFEASADEAANQALEADPNKEACLSALQVGEGEEGNRIPENLTVAKAERLQDTAALILDVKRGEASSKTEGHGPAATSPVNSNRHDLDTVSGIEDFDHPTATDHETLPLTTSNGPLSDVLDRHENDDAHFLHEFLIRSKARKAAKMGANLGRGHEFATQPESATRQALAVCDPNSPSLRKRSTSEVKPETKDMTTEMPIKTSARSPTRRSTRTRLSKLQRSSAHGPSTIPVRRLNGPEIVTLQKTESQEVALATRLNTKHNKGNAILPKFKLQVLSPPPHSPTESPKRPNGIKEVSWDEKLAYVTDLDREEGVINAGEGKVRIGRRKTRNIRKLGAFNGTPARSRTMAVESEDMSAGKAQCHGIALALEMRLPRTRAKTKAC